MNKYSELTENFCLGSAELQSDDGWKPEVFAELVYRLKIAELVLTLADTNSVNDDRATAIAESFSGTEYDVRHACEEIINQARY